MKKLFFVSTGRCGTLRLYQILREKLAPQKINVVHQMNGSRLANVLSNINYSMPVFNAFKHEIYELIIKRNCFVEGFVSTDPLTAMIIPDEYINDAEETAIIHIIRNAIDFADSMFRLTRTRPQSWIAHNLIPFWQPELLPLENMLNVNIVKKYERICNIKNDFFQERYGRSANYYQLKMDEVFGTNQIQTIVNKWFDISIDISFSELSLKANISAQ